MVTKGETGWGWGGPDNSYYLPPSSSKQHFQHLLAATTWDSKWRRATSKGEFQSYRTTLEFTLLPDIISGVLLRSNTTQWVKTNTKCGVPWTICPGSRLPLAVQVLLQEKHLICPKRVKEGKQRGVNRKEQKVKRGNRELRQGKEVKEGQDTSSIRDGMADLNFCSLIGNWVWVWLCFLLSHQLLYVMSWLNTVSLFVTDMFEVPSQQSILHDPQFPHKAPSRAVLWIQNDRRGILLLTGCISEALHRRARNHTRTIFYYVRKYLK